MVGIRFLPCNRTVASSNLTYPSHCIVTLDKLITLILRKATGNPQITTSSEGVKARWTRIRAENSLSNVGLSSKYEGAVHSMSPSSLGTFPLTHVYGFCFCRGLEDSTCSDNSCRGPDSHWNRHIFHYSSS